MESCFFKAHSCMGKKPFKEQMGNGVGQAINIILYFKILRQFKREITGQQLLKQSEEQEVFKTRKKFDHKQRTNDLYINPSSATKTGSEKLQTAAHSC